MPLTDPNAPAWVEHRRIAAEIEAPVPDTAEYVTPIYTHNPATNAPELAGMVWIIQGDAPDEGRIETWIMPGMEPTETELTSSEGVFSAIMVNQTRFRASHIVRRDKPMDNRAARAKMDAIRAQRPKDRSDP